MERKQKERQIISCCPLDLFCRSSSVWVSMLMEWNVCVGDHFWQSYWRFSLFGWILEGSLGGRGDFGSGQCCEGMIRDLFLETYEQGRCIAYLVYTPTYSLYFVYTFVLFIFCSHPCYFCCCCYHCLYFVYIFSVCTLFLLCYFAILFLFCFSHRVLERNVASSVWHASHERIFKTIPPVAL